MGEVSVEVTAIHYIKRIFKKAPNEKIKKIKREKNLVKKNHIEITYLHFPSYLAASEAIEAVASLVVVDLTLDVEA